jgi:hypothetical protein
MRTRTRIKVIQDWKPFKRHMTKKRRELLEKLELGVGDHLDPKDGVCVMEALAYITGQKFTDHPVCVSGTITAYLIEVNDEAGTIARQKLKDLIPTIMHTAPTERRVVEKPVWGTDKMVKVVEERQVGGYRNPDYFAAEKARRRLLNEAQGKDENGYYTVETALELVPKLVKLGKF